MTREIEIPFQWTCPKCQHQQTDTVNPELGPYCTLICGQCQQVVVEQDLSEEDAQAWDLACAKAEGYLPDDK